MSIKIRYWDNNSGEEVAYYKKRTIELLIWRRRLLLLIGFLAGVFVSFLAQNLFSQTLPALIVRPPKTTPVYVTCLAWSTNPPDGVVSKEYSFVATNNLLSLVWSVTNSPNVGYSIFWGTNSGEPRWSLDVGTNEAVTIEAIPTQPQTNFFKVYPMWAQSLFGPWTTAAAPVMTVTNFSGAGIPPIGFFRVLAVQTNQ